MKSAMLGLGSRTTMDMVTPVEAGGHGKVETVLELLESNTGTEFAVKLRFKQI